MTRVVYECGCKLNCTCTYDVLSGGEECYEFQVDNSGYEYEVCNIHRDLMVREYNGIILSKPRP